MTYRIVGICVILACMILPLAGCAGDGGGSDGGGDGETPSSNTTSE